MANITENSLFRTFRPSAGAIGNAKDTLIKVGVGDAAAATSHPLAKLFWAKLVRFVWANLVGFGQN